MIKHILDTVGLIFSKIESIKPIPQPVLDKLYIDHDISKISGNLLSYSEVFDTGLVLIHDDIKSFNSNTVFTMETSKVIPSGTKTDMNKYSHLSQYILIPDIVKCDKTDISTVVNIIYNIFEILSKRIRYYSSNGMDLVVSLPLVLTSYILCEYGIVPTPASVLRVLLGEDNDKVTELAEIIDDHNVILSLYSGVNITKDYIRLKIMRDEKCQIIEL